jgi:hypothetical protein
MKIIKKIIKNNISESKYQKLVDIAWFLRGKRSKVVHAFIPMLFNDDEFLKYVLKKKIGLERNFDKISTLVLKGSHADYSFIPDYFESSFNLGLTSSDLFNTFAIYKSYSHKFDKLDNIIVFYSVFSSGYSLINTSSRYLTVVYNYFFGTSYDNYNLIDSKYEKLIIGKCDEITKVGLDVEIDYKGYENKTYYMKNISAKSRVKTHLRENLREPDQLEWLVLLNKEIIKDNRRLTVVIPPARSDYKAKLPSEDVVFKKIIDAQLENVEIINLYNSQFFLDSDFGDTDHLNDDGAKKMTIKLKEIFIEKGFV